jgi:hypothetical protein
MSKVYSNPYRVILLPKEKMSLKYEEGWFVREYWDEVARCEGEKK